ncbi:MAG: hypothetical protein GY854_30680 [Deltaproteobacteria bacterium]|nr:hypothetical protein [Deltaproteobacteria bacterium]
MDRQNERESQTLLVRFLDAFLNENNIKWILGAGILIVLGSSAMLVASHWDSYTPLWKYSVMFVYTAAIYGMGRVAYLYLGLRTTGNALMALTVLLLPVLYVAMHFVQGAGFWLSIPSAVFMMITVAFTYMAAGQIFKHFLRKDSPVFLLSYVALSVSGALASLAPSSLAPFIAVFLWVIYCVGLIKVNRHVFWLGEEHRTPRIFGFFPIALLSTQFLVVFFLYLASRMDLSWVGFGLALLALPMFMTADTVWDVHKQRTGLLPKPKLSVILPILVGLGLTMGSLCLAGFGFFSGESPYALVPTALVAAVLMAMVARRTEKAPFVWLMIIAGLVAYNFSPVLFQDVARAVVDRGASAVSEERLPYAFYGLTYLPLFCALLVLGHRFLRSGQQLFGRPIRLTSIALAGIWLVMATTHAKAMTPVGLAMTTVFVASAYLYRLPGLLLPAAGAWLLAAFGGLHFVNTVVLDHPYSFGRSLGELGPFLFIMSAATLLLTTPGRYMEKLLRARVGTEGSILENMSAICTALLCVFWTFAFWGAALLNYEVDTITQVISGAIIMGLLVVHGLRVNHMVLKWFSILFAYAIGIILWLPARPSMSVLTSVLTIVLFGQWVLGYLAERYRVPAALRAFQGTIQKSAHAGLTAMVVVMTVFPIFLFGDFEPWWISRILTVAFAFDAARRGKSSFHGYAAPFSVFLVLASATLTILGPAQGIEWLPAVIAASVLALMPLLLWLESLQRDWNLSPAYEAITIPLRHTLTALLVTGAFGTLLFFTLHLRIAGALCLVGLWMIANDSKTKSYVFALGNWHLLAALIGALNPSFQALEFEALKPLTVTALVATSGLSALIWRAVVGKLKKVASWSYEPEILRVHRTFLRVVAATGLIFAACMTLSTIGLCLSALGFALFIADEVWAACSQQSVSRVWCALAIGAAAVGFFFLHEVIHFGGGISMFAMLGVGAGFWFISQATRGHAGISILSDPLRWTALAMPALSACIGAGRELVGLGTYWPGMSSLALLLAAIAYFAHGLTHGVKWSLIASQLIVNIALFLLWGELSFTDPQLFMIPVGISILFLTYLLRDEIPAEFRTPLHYLGAMIILVSPTFNIISGNWFHIFSLMFISVLVMVAAIGLRMRALLYMGASFLAADIVAMVVRSSIDRPNTLWIAGLVLGAAVVSLGAFSENNREKLMQRIRAFGAALETWN